MTPRRWVILVVALPIYTFVMMVASTTALRIILLEEISTREFGQAIDDVWSVFEDSEWWGWVGTIWFVAVAAQILFLLPIVQNRPPVGTRPKSLVASLLLAGLIAGVLTAGLLMALLNGLMMVFADKTFDDGDDWLWFVLLGMLLTSWITWTLILVFFVRGIWADRVLGRVIGVLVGGSILEIIIALPIDIMVRRRTDCYCTEGTFFSLVLSASALLWLAGPGAVVAIMSKRHRLWRETRCENCGYEKGPSPGPQCPECGTKWIRRPSTTRPH